LLSFGGSSSTRTPPPNIRKPLPPLQVRAQTQKVQVSVLDNARHIFKVEGARGFFRGITPPLILKMGRREPACLCLLGGGEGNSYPTRVSVMEPCHMVLDRSFIRCSNVGNDSHRLVLMRLAWSGTTGLAFGAFGWYRALLSKPEYVVEETGDVVLPIWKVGLAGALTGITLSPLITPAGPFVSPSAA
jgi:hypothetical protein